MPATRGGGTRSGSCHVISLQISLILPPLRARRDCHPAESIAICKYFSSTVSINRVENACTILNAQSFQTSFARALSSLDVAEQYLGRFAEHMNSFQLPRREEAAVKKLSACDVFLHRISI